MSLKKIAEKILPFLFSKITLIWDSLSQEEKDALIKSGQIGQIIKLELANGAEVVLVAIATKLGLTPVEVESTLLALATAMGYKVTTVNEFIDFLQAKIDKGLSDEDWDLLWETISGWTHLDTNIGTTFTLDDLGISMMSAPSGTIGGSAVPVEVFRVGAKGIQATACSTYSNDAAADADSALPSGGLYMTTAGGRTVFRKP